MQPLTVTTEPLGKKNSGPYVFMRKLMRSLPEGKAVGKWDGEADILIVFDDGGNGLWNEVEHKVVVDRCDGLYFIRGGGLNWGGNTAARQRWEAADGLVFQSDYCKRMYEYLIGETSTPGRVIHNGTDVPFTPLEGREKSVLCCASWRPSKRPQMVVDVARRLPDVQFTVLGKKFKVDHVPDNVKLVGAVPRNVVPQYLARHKVFLHTGFQDPCPNVVIEALASGMVVVGAWSGGTPDLLGSQGYLYDEADESFDPIKPEEVPLPDIRQVVELVYKALEFPYVEPRTDLHISRTALQYTSFFEELLYG